MLVSTSRYSVQANCALAVCRPVSNRLPRKGVKPGHHGLRITRCGPKRAWYYRSEAAFERNSMIRDLLFLILFFVLLGAWATSWLAFHIAGGMIHLLLVFAVIFLIVHLFRGRRAA